MTGYETLKANLSTIFSLIGFNQADRVVVGGWKIVQTALENENNFRKATFKIISLFENGDFEKLVLNDTGDESFHFNIHNYFVVEDFTDEIVEEERTLLTITCYQTYSEC